MGDTGTPYDLEPLKEPLIEAVINAYMAKNLAGTAGLSFDHGSCKEGEFRFKKDSGGLLDGDTLVYVSYPGGQWKEDESWSPDNELENDDSPMFGVTLFDAVAVYDKIRADVSSWLDPWVGCSSPHVFTNQISSIGSIIDTLYVQDEVRLGGNPVSMGGEGSTSVPVSDVQSAIADMRSELSSLNGLAIDALESAYVNDIGLTISGQRALVAVAGLAIAGEAEAWNQAYLNLAELFENATADFNSLAASHGASGQGATSALSIISTVTGAAAAGAFAFPPAAAALGVVSGIAGIGAAFYPAEAGQAQTSITLEGSDYASMWSSFEQAVRAVNSELTDAEYNLAMMCRNATADMGANPDAFSITARGSDGSRQANDDLPRFLGTGPGSPDKELYAGDSITIVHPKLRKVAAQIEHVGDHQREVAARLGGNDAAGNPSALVSDEWGRQYLQGSIIGWGPSGHYGDFSSLVDAVVDLLVGEARVAHRTAEHCLDISTGFKLTEEQIEAQLDRLESRLGP